MVLFGACAEVLVHRHGICGGRRLRHTPQEHGPASARSRQVCSRTRRLTELVSLLQILDALDATSSFESIAECTYAKRSWRSSTFTPMALYARALFNHSNMIVIKFRFKYNYSKF